MTQRAASALDTLIGNPVDAVTASGNLIRLVIFRSHISISTWAGPTRLDDWSVELSATTPAQRKAACAEASRALALFDAYDGPRGVAQRAEQLRWYLNQQDQRRTGRDHAGIAAAEKELTTLEDLATRRLRQQVARPIAA